MDERNARLRSEKNNRRVEEVALVIKDDTYVIEYDSLERTAAKEDSVK